MAGRRRSPATSWKRVSDRFRDLADRRPPGTISRIVHPQVLRLLGPLEGRRVLDVGCGRGAFARKLAARGARVIGIDTSPRAVEMARRDAKEAGLDPPPHFEVADAHDPEAYPEGGYHAATLVLSLQGMERPEAVLRNVARALRRGGRLVVALHHPCFRIPGATGWGRDPVEGARFRRVDRYLSSHPLPQEAPEDEDRLEPVSASHWPLERLFHGLRGAGFAVIDLVEPPGERGPEGEEADGGDPSAEIPLFLILLARRGGRRARSGSRKPRRSG